MRREAELVIALCRPAVSGAALANAARILAGSVDWELFFAWAGAWRVDPAVMMNLQRHFHRAVPADVLARAGFREKESRAFAMARTLAVVDLVSRLETNGIPAMVLKGAAVGASAYGDISLRPFADMDILVAPGDMRRARDIVLGMGYQREFDAWEEDRLLAAQHALEFTRLNSKAELHCALLSSHLRFGLDARDVWRNAVMIDCLGNEVRAPSPAHHFLFLCAHGTKHGWVSLHWICDIAQMAERLGDREAAEILALADTLHARRILALALRVARDVVGIERSPFPADALVPESDTNDLVELARRSLTGTSHESTGRSRLARLHPNLETLSYWNRSRERMLDRVASLAYVFFVPTAQDRGTGPLSWVARPLRLSITALRRLARSRA